MKSILHIEDEELYGEVIRRLHETVAKRFHGEVKFRTVRTWNDAGHEIENDPPSVVLLDLNLGIGQEHSDTLYLLDKVRGWPPVMVLTANRGELDLRRKCFMAGADDFILKDEANRNPELLCERIYHCFLRRLRDESRA